jgi:hypothetical protein
MKIVFAATILVLFVVVQAAAATPTMRLEYYHTGDAAQ